MAALLARRDREGMSLRQLAAETGIALGTLSWWTWRLRQDGAAEEEGDQGPLGGFVELATANRQPPAGDRITIELACGTRLEVDARINSEALRRIVAALQPC
jgi:hypothetical protein